MPLCLPIAEAAWFPPVQLLSPVTLLLSDGSLPAARQVPPGSQNHQSWKRKSSFPPILSEGWGVFEKANEYSLRLFLYVSPSNSFNYFHTCSFHIFIWILFGLHHYKSYVASYISWSSYQFVLSYLFSWGLSGFLEARVLHRRTY